MLVVIWRGQSTGYATLSAALHTQELSLTHDMMGDMKSMMEKCNAMMENMQHENDDA
jgi:hypothetical protein